MRGEKPVSGLLPLRTAVLVSWLICTSCIGGDDDGVVGMSCFWFLGACSFFLVAFGVAPPPGPGTLGPGSWFESM